MADARTLPTSLTAALQQPNAAYAVGVLAEKIADLMAGIHGGEWVCSIDHDCQFVLIFPSVLGGTECAS